MNSTARQMNHIQRTEIALQAISNKNSITEIANDSKVSRGFVHKQVNKAMQGIHDAFANVEATGVLYYIPVTINWIKGLIVNLALHCRANYRGMQSVLEDCIDFSTSIGSISNVLNHTATTANAHNLAQDLSDVTLGAHDEMFVNNKPILTGIDIPSLYCYLLSMEDRRDGETWAINIFDLQKQGFKPERVIADDGSGLRSGHAIALSDIPCDYDNFHISKDMMEMRQFFRNKYRSALTEYLDYSDMVNDAAHVATREKYKNLLPEADAQVKLFEHISTTINTLISWMEHDVFNMPGSQVKPRHELFDFILSEFEKLADIHPHRIQSLCTKLRNQKNGLLAFVDVLDDKFLQIAAKYGCSSDFVWEVCELQRCEHGGDNYNFRSIQLLEDVGDALFDLIECDVLAALNSTEKASSMVENYNGRVKQYADLRKGCNQSFLNLLRFYLNHVPFRRSELATRVNKSPVAILTGKAHNHWMEMLGYTLFKRAAA